MEAGRAVSVNLGKYLDVFDHAGLGEDVQILKDVLAKHGISEKATFYRGPQPFRTQLTRLF